MARTDSFFRTAATIAISSAVVGVPLCVWGVELPTPAGGLGPLDATQWDRYAYTKGLLTIGLGAIALASSLRMLKCFPALVFLGALWLSTGLSHDFQRSLWGFPHHREGALVWTAYVGLYAGGQGMRERAYGWLVHGVLLSSAVMCVLALSEFEKDGIAVSTLGHGNYFAGYLSMLLPLVLDRLTEASNQRDRWAFGGLMTLMVGGLFASQARGGMVAAALAVALVLVLRRERLRNAARPLLVCTIGSLALVSAMVPFATEQFYRKTTEQWRESDFQDLVVTDSEATLTYRGSTLRIYQSGKEILFTRADGFPLAVQQGVAEWTFLDPAVAVFSIQPRHSSIGNLIVVKVGSYALPFLIEPGRFGLVTVGQSFRSEVPRLAFGTTEYDQAFSGRVYIWNRLLPLLPRHLLIGAGSDHFPDEFPQRDFLGKANIYHELRAFIDRPHSLYLGMLHAGGLPFLLGALGLWFAALRGSWRRNEAGLFAAIVAFLVQGLVNDSVIGVSTVFWVLAGLSASDGADSSPAFPQSFKTPVGPAA